MTKKYQHPRGLADPFGEASTKADNGLEELVKLIARISAEKDYNEVLDSSNPGYTTGKKKDRTP